MRRREFSTLLGGAATASTIWPSPLSAQKATPVIGYLNGGVPGRAAPYAVAFRQGLSETGYVEGQNLAIEYRWAEDRYNRLPALTVDLVGRGVDVDVCSRRRLATRGERSDFDDPNRSLSSWTTRSATGVVASLARPGGNLTGLTLFAVELNPKRLELMRELVPQAGIISLLVNPSNGTTERVMRDVQDWARQNGVQVHILKASSESAIDEAFVSLVRSHAGALLVATDPFFSGRRDQLVALASRHAVPAIYGWREFAASGGLISYGVSLTAIYRQAGIYAGRILKGAKPADLPVVQPTTFELVVNLKTAEALGLAVPPSILARADEVIE